MCHAHRFESYTCLLQGFETCIQYRNTFVIITIIFTWTGKGRSPGRLHPNSHPSQHPGWRRHLPPALGLWWLRRCCCGCCCVSPVRSALQSSWRSQYLRKLSGIRLSVTFEVLQFCLADQIMHFMPSMTFLLFHPCVSVRLHVQVWCARNLYKYYGYIIFNTEGS